MDVDDEPIPGLGPDGRPDPAYARRLGLRPAPGGRASAAFALDAASGRARCPGAIGGRSSSWRDRGRGAAMPPRSGCRGARPAARARRPSARSCSRCSAPCSSRCTAGEGVTLGKASFGIRSVNVATFGAAGFWRVVLRALVLWAGQLVLPFVGPALLFASSAWDPERRGRSWLDRVGRCYAIDVRHGLNPLDREGAASRAPGGGGARGGRGRRARRRSPATGARRATVHPVGALELGRGRLGPGEAGGMDAARGRAAARRRRTPRRSRVAASAPSRRTAAFGPRRRARRGPRVRRRQPAAGVRPGLLGRGPAPAPGEATRRRSCCCRSTTTRWACRRRTRRSTSTTARCWVIDRWSRNGTAIALPRRRSGRSSPVCAPRCRQGGRVLLGGRSS